MEISADIQEAVLRYRRRRVHDDALYKSTFYLPLLTYNTVYRFCNKYTGTRREIFDMC